MIQTNYSQRSNQQESVCKTTVPITLGLLTISDKVKVIDYRGSLDADKLTFDLNNQTLNVATYNKIGMLK